MVTGSVFVLNQTLKYQNTSTVSSKHDENIKLDVRAIFEQFLGVNRNRNGYQKSLIWPKVTVFR